MLQFSCPNVHLAAFISPIIIKLIKYGHEHRGFLLFGHPGGVLKSELCAAYLLLAQVNVFPELSDSIQGGVVLKTQPADLKVKQIQVTGYIKTSHLDFLFLTHSAN